MQRHWRYFKYREKVDYIIKSSDTHRMWKTGAIKQVGGNFQVVGIIWELHMGKRK